MLTQLNVPFYGNSTAFISIIYTHFTLNVVTSQLVLFQCMIYYLIFQVSHCKIGFRTFLSTQGMIFIRFGCASSRGCFMKISRLWRSQVSGFYVSAYSDFSSRLYRIIIIFIYIGASMSFYASRCFINMNDDCSLYAWGAYRNGRRA